MTPFLNLTSNFVHPVRLRLQHLFSESKFLFESGSGFFTETLIELSDYKSEKLVQRALHLLNRHFSAESMLFQSAIQTQLLITEESKKVRFTIGCLVFYIYCVQYPLPLMQYCLSSVLGGYYINTGV